MKHHIYNKVSLLLLTSAIFLLPSCYDLTEMSHNPYALESGGEATEGEIVDVDDETKYADINLSKNKSAPYPTSSALSSIRAITRNTSVPRTSPTMSIPATAPTTSPST